MTDYSAPNIPDLAPTPRFGELMCEKLSHILKIVLTSTLSDKIANRTIRLVADAVGAHQESTQFIPDRFDGRIAEHVAFDEITANPHSALGKAFFSFEHFEAEIDSVA